MRTYVSFALAAASVLALGGCFKATFVADPSMANLGTAPEESAARGPTGEPVRVTKPVTGWSSDEWHSFWLFGLVGTADVDARAVCPQGAAVVRTGGNVGTTLVTIATLGIYAPRKVYVRCHRAPGSPAPTDE